MSRQLWARGIWGIAVSLASSAVAIAGLPPQQAGNDPQQTQQQQRQGQFRTFSGNDGNRPMAARMGVDHLMVKVLINANKDEIEMGKLAEQRSGNADVKQLATQMVQDHERFLNQLESFRGEGGRQTASPQQQGRAAFRGNPQEGQDQTQQPQQPGQQQPQTRQQLEDQLHRLGAQNTQQPTNGNLGFAGQPRRDGMAGMEHGPAAQFAKIMEEVDRNMQQSLMRDLSSKQGADFDRCYLGSQLFGHMWVIEALKTFERDASPQLKPILQEGLQASKQHLTHIKSVLAKLDNEPASRSALQSRGNRLPR